MRVLVEKYRQSQTEVHCVFVDHNMVMRETWLLNEEVRSVREIRSMHKDREKVVRCAAGAIDGFTVEVESHQGSALSPLVCGGGDGRTDR